MNQWWLYNVCADGQGFDNLTNMPYPAIVFTFRARFAASHKEIAVFVDVSFAVFPAFAFLHTEGGLQGSWSKKCQWYDENKHKEALKGRQVLELECNSHTQRSDSELRD